MTGISACIKVYSNVIEMSLFTSKKVLFVVVMAMVFLPVLSVATGPSPMRKLLE